jgi:cysteine synthase A
LEWFNFSGSIKARPAYFILKHLIETGKLSKGDSFIEATSGNMGIALASIASLFKLKPIIVMPENMSEERKIVLRSLGATLIFTPAEGNVLESKKLAEKISHEQKLVYIKQFDNSMNVIAHELTTGPEIISQIKTPIDAFVAGVGTGGTITGVGRALRKIYPDVKLFGVKPKDEKNHIIQGIGDGFKPAIYDTSLITEEIHVSNEEALQMHKELAQTYGLFVGISSAANAYAAIKIKEQYNLKTVVTVFPDDGYKYLSIIKNTGVQP